MEEWKDINGYNGRYQISTMGRVKSTERIRISGANDSCKMLIPEMVLKEKINHGYSHVNLYDNGKCITHKVHRLVALAFIPNPDDKPEVNHKDGDKSNNNDWNLEWSTSLENKFHAKSTGLLLPMSGEKHYLSKLTEVQVREIRDKYATKNYSILQLAKEYNMSHQPIHNIIKRVSWKHVI